MNLSSSDKYNGVKTKWPLRLQVSPPVDNSYDQRKVVKCKVVDSKIMQSSFFTKGFSFSWLLVSPFSHQATCQLWNPNGSAFELQVWSLFVCLQILEKGGYYSQGRGKGGSWKQDKAPAASAWSHLLTSHWPGRFRECGQESI